MKPAHEEKQVFVHPDQSPDRNQFPRETFLFKIKSKNTMSHLAELSILDSLMCNIYKCLARLSINQHEGYMKKKT